jgi:hypothetical protein
VVLAKAALLRMSDDVFNSSASLSGGWINSKFILFLKASVSLTTAVKSPGFHLAATIILT